MLDGAFVNPNELCDLIPRIVKPQSLLECQPSLPYYKLLFNHPDLKCYDVLREGCVNIS